MQNTPEGFDKAFEYGMCEREKVKSFISQNFLPRSTVRSVLEEARKAHLGYQDELIGGILTALGIEK